MKIVVTILVGCVLCLPSLKAHADNVPQELNASINIAEADGLALFRADQDGAKPDEKAVADSKIKISDFCNYAYKPVLASQRGGKALFFLAQPSRPESLVFGRHYKLLAQKVIVSTKTCFEIGFAPPNAVGAYITHLLSPAPTEFHVFLSLKHKTSIYVATSAGMWAVDKGKVRLIGKHK